MRILAKIKNGKIYLNDYDLFVPVINGIYVKTLPFHTNYLYHPYTGKRIVEHDINTWFLSEIPGIKNVIYWSSLDYDHNIISINPPDNEIDLTNIEAIIDYTERKCQTCPNLKVGGFDTPFCNLSGYRKGYESSCREVEKNVFKTGNVYGYIINKEKDS